MKRIEIRIHGRGGQGSVIASKILAQAYAIEYPDIYVQAFPEFGAERRGAPVVAFIRVADKRKNRIETPDHVIILSDSLIIEAGALKGLKHGGWVILNSTLDPASKELGLLSCEYHIALVDAVKIASEFGIGQKTQPVVNTVILGSFAKASAHFENGSISLSALEEAIRINEEIPNPEKNIKACVKACEETVLHYCNKEGRG